MQQWIAASAFESRLSPERWDRPQLSVAGGVSAGTGLAPDQKKPQEIGRDREG